MQEGGGVTDRSELFWPEENTLAWAGVGVWWGLGGGRSGCAVLIAEVQRTQRPADFTAGPSHLH